MSTFEVAFYTSREEYLDDAPTSRVGMDELDDLLWHTNKFLREYHDAEDVIVEIHRERTARG